MPSRLRTARGRRSRRTDRNTTTTVAIAAAVRTKVSIRLVNSTTPCAASSGVVTKLVSVQRGHVGQPRPEPVSRTAPPVTTIAPLATALTRAVRETAAEEIGTITDARWSPPLSTVVPELSRAPAHLPCGRRSHDQRVLPRRIRRLLRRPLRGLCRRSAAAETDRHHPAA